ncbi:MAG TPA: SRPBCC family protein [Candidatus Nitrosotalea sp.]|nr:SRPBCC family protein [Candidatus Nitrosotalea sp.]
MQIENQFEVAADPDRVYAFLLDVNNVAGCMPGAELTEVVDADTFNGRVKIKVGPVTVAYNGTARIIERVPEERRAVLEAEGRETTGSGSARARVTMSVAPEGTSSVVRLASDFTVAGKVANFGRGMMEDVSRRLVGQMGQAIKQRLEQPRDEPAEMASDTGWSPPGSAAAAPPSPASTPPASPSKPPETVAVNAFGLIWAVTWDRVKKLFGR